MNTRWRRVMPSLGSVARTLIACFQIGHTASDLLLKNKSTGEPECNQIRVRFRKTTMASLNQLSLDQ